MDWLGAGAHLAASGRASYSRKALSVSAPIQSPVTREPAADISNMLSKMGSGSPGDNLDVWA